jgi:AraC-like DNA-binding protein
MTVEAIFMDRLTGTPPPPLSVARVVVSTLDRGETHIAGSALSLKLVIEGEEIYHVDGRVHRLTPGHMLLVDGGAAYEATIRSGRTRGLCVYLPEYARSSLSDEHLPLGRAMLRSVATVRGGDRLLALARMVHENRLTADQAAPWIVQAAGAVIEAGRADAAEQMHRLALKRASARRDVLNRLEVARAHLHGTLDRPVPLAELADLAGMSPFHLARYFTAAFGSPPGRYHRTLRLQLAANLLRTGSVLATEAAERIGYSELAAFSHAFRREFGHPPSLDLAAR